MSSSITWLAHHRVGLDVDGKPALDAVIMVTDRAVLDDQIRENIRRFAQVTSINDGYPPGRKRLRPGGWLTRGGVVLG